MDNQTGKVIVFKTTVPPSSLQNKLGVIGNHWIENVSNRHWYDVICFDGTRVVDVTPEQVDVLASDINDFCEIALGHNPSDNLE